MSVDYYRIFWESAFYVAMNNVRKGWHEQLKLGDDDPDDDETCVQKMLVQATVQGLQVGAIAENDDVEEGDDGTIPWSIAAAELTKWGVKPDAVLAVYKTLEMADAARFN